MSANVLIAAYTKFQLGTGSKPDVINVENKNALYEYGQAGRAGLDTDKDGYKEVDCSSLVWSALKDAGYKVPEVVDGFNTKTLFNGENPTSPRRADSFTVRRMKTMHQ